MKGRKKVAILISGKGSNMRALIKDMMNADHPGKPALIVSDKKDSEGIEFAKTLNIKTLIINSNSQVRESSFEYQLLKAVQRSRIDLICLAGFMRVLSEDFITNFKNHIINIHPSILPLFKGLNTHKKALDSGMAVHGATVHIVTPEIDSGKILGQAIVPISKGDTENLLKERVLLVEHRLYPLVLRRILTGYKNFPLMLEK